MAKRLILALLLGLAAGWAGETLLLLERHCTQAERLLREDFAVLLFLKEEPEASRQKVLAEKLLALPRVAAACYVSSQEALSRVRRADPELVESVTLVGDNPLQPAYEVRLTSLERLEEWLSQAQALADWADIRYKPAQVKAALQAGFYASFLNLAWSALLCLGGLMAAAALWASRRGGLSRRGALAALSSAAGAGCGAVLASLAAWPIRAVSPWWAWPSGGCQALLLLGAAAAGWVLCGSGE